MVPRRKQATRFERTIDANQIVGVNFRIARELRGWTQEQTAERLAPHMNGQVLPKTSISAMERVLDRDRRRVFNAQEILAFAQAFDLPVWWFFLPIPNGDGYGLEGTTRDSTYVLSLLLGRAEHMDALRERLTEIGGWADGPERDAVLSEVVGVPSWRHFEETRKLLIREMAQEQAVMGERLFEQMRSMVDQYDALRGLNPVTDDLQEQVYMDWFPSRVYGRTSEMLLGERTYYAAVRPDKAQLPRVTALLARSDLPLEEWVDLEDPEMMRRIRAVYEHWEKQLGDRDIPPSTDRP